MKTLATFLSPLGEAPTWSERAISQHPKHLQVIIDKRYPYAIVASLSRHDSSVPCEPCSPALRSF